MITITCFNCGISVQRKKGKRSVSSNYFCSQSCAAKVNNKLSPKRFKSESCAQCGIPVYAGRKYCSKECFHSKPKTKANNGVKNVVAFYKRTKEKAVEYLGGACKNCGYSKCLAALEFHHRDPSTKEFAISGGTRSWERIRAELDKCDLLCANCHREVEFNSA